MRWPGVLSSWRSRVDAGTLVTCRSSRKEVAMLPLGRRSSAMFNLPAFKKVSGSGGSGSIHVGLRELDFIFYEVVFGVGGTSKVK